MAFDIAPGGAEKRWIILRLRPEDLLALMHAAGSGASIETGAWPPDTRLIETETLPDGWLLAILESDFFETCWVMMDDGMLTGDYAVATLNFRAVDEDDEPEPEDELGFRRVTEARTLPDYPPMRDVEEVLREVITTRLPTRLTNVSGAELLTMLQPAGENELPPFPVYPRDTQVLSAFNADHIQGWTLLLHHEEFSPPQSYEENGELLHEIDSDGHGMQFRFAIRGAE